MEGRELHSSIFHVCEHAKVGPLPTLTHIDHGESFGTSFYAFLQAGVLKAALVRFIMLILLG